MTGFRGRPPKEGSDAWFRRFGGGPIVTAPTATPAKPIATREETLADAEKKFSILDVMVTAMAAGIIKGQLVTGGPGIGKTFTFERILGAALEKGDIKKYSRHSGSISAPKLYETLWEHREDGNVLVLDDCDGVWYDEESLSLLKAALDTGDVRRISWLKNSKMISEGGVDPTFIFRGSVAFISNIDFQRYLDNRNSKLSDHIRAVESRTHYLDLGLHSLTELLYWVEYSVTKFGIMEAHGVSKAEQSLGLEWLHANKSHLRSLSIRSCVKLAEYMRMAKLPNVRESWQDLAKANLLRA